MARAGSGRTARTRYDWFESFNTECLKLEIPLDVEVCPTKLQLGLITNPTLVNNYGGEATVVRCIWDFFMEIPNAENCGPPANVASYSFVCRAGTRINQTLEAYPVGDAGLYAVGGTTERKYTKIYHFGSIGPTTSGTDGCATISLLRHREQHAIHWHVDQKKRILMRGNDELVLDMHFRPFRLSGPFDSPTNNLTLEGYAKTLVRMG